MTDESEIVEAAVETASETADEFDEPTIWGQPSDVDWWGRTTVDDYDELLQDDGGICGECGADVTEEDIEDLQLE